MADAQSIDVVLFAALGELVRLNVLQTDDRLGHDTAVPVTAEALLACVRRLNVKLNCWFCICGHAVFNDDLLSVSEVVLRV